MERDDFGVRLSLAMKVLNISPGALASAARADKSLVSRWMRGLATPRGPYLAVLTEIVGARVPGFTQLTWDLALEDFGRALQGETAAPRAIRTAEPVVTRRPSRRLAIAGGALAAAAAAAVGGSALLLPRKRRAGAVDEEVSPLLEQAAMGLRQSDTQGNAQAIGLYRRVVAMRPKYADGWGRLAYAYALEASLRPGAETAAITARARDAAAHALAIDPENGYAHHALMSLGPSNRWRLAEQDLRRALRRQPDDEILLGGLGFILAEVGRWRESAEAFDRSLAHNGPFPLLVYMRARSLWGAGRLDEADAAIQEAFMLYPKSVGVWFTRFDILAYGGRPQEALAMAQDRAGRPNGIPDESFEQIIAGAKALASGKAEDQDAAMRLYLAAARQAVGAAQNAMEFASAIGRIDDAFALSEAYYFDRGFKMSEVRYSAVQGMYRRRNDRRTFVLFRPMAAPMRADRRFEALVTEIGLTRYWQEAGVQPDYRRPG